MNTMTLHKIAMKSQNESTEVLAELSDEFIHMMGVASYHMCGSCDNEKLMEMVGQLPHHVNRLIMLSATQFLLNERYKRKLKEIEKTN